MGVRVVVGGVAVFGLAALVGTSLRRVGLPLSTSLTMFADPVVEDRIVPNTTVRIYKRTHSSGNALLDATWARDSLGLDYVLNETYRCASDSPGARSAGGTPCAERMIVTALADWDMHYYQSYITPQWNISVKKWADEWASSHYPDGSAGAFEWSAWTPMGVTFYAPTLVPFLDAWASSGVASLRRRAGPVYSARVVAPHSGHAVSYTHLTLPTILLV